jgi:CheY-like chemotaxis protein
MSENDPSTAASVLVIEDDPHAMAAVADALEDEGYRVRRAVNGMAALQEIKAQAPDLVVSDVHMPVFSEGALIRSLRELDLPVVLISADTNWSRTPGVVFVRKPIDLDHLLTVVADMLDSGEG